MTNKAIGVILCGAAVATLLGACSQQSDPVEPEETPAADQTPVSIIRPDIEVVREEPPLKPLEMRLSFADGGDELSDIVLADLATLMASPQYEAGGTIVLRSHTDSSGSDQVNMRASQSRGEAVRDFLVESGADPERIKVIAFGEQNPVQPNAKPDGTPNEEGRAANRRIDVTVQLPTKAGPAPESAFDAAGDDEATEGVNAE